jgi:hypothetical protein
MKHKWYVDNGCSKDMTGDKDRFLTLKKERDGSVSFGNENLAKNIGKGIVNIISKDAMTRKCFVGRRHQKTFY